MAHQRSGALRCAHCYDSHPINFPTITALTIHIELAHRTMGTCSYCGREDRYINIGDDGTTWCVDDGQCFDSTGRITA
jgi:hypothetical protein